MVAPAVLKYEGPVATSDRIAGPIVVFFAVVSAWIVLRALRWTILPVAVWVAAGPLVLNGHAAAAVSDLVAAVLLVALTPPQGGDSEKYGGGWRSLIRA